MKLATFIFGGTISLVIQYYADYYKQTDLNKTLDELKPDLQLPRIQTYDFIVVGGGTGGSLIAGKLSEHFNVLLLEAGGTPVPATFNPFLNAFVSSHPAINNLFVSVPQRNFSLDNGGIVTSPTGRMLGGSGSHNGNLYQRGSPHDYDNFANLTKDNSWAYKNVLKIFKRFENFRGHLVQEEQRDEFYEKSGQFHVETDWPPIISSWFQSANELGFNIGDPNGYQTESFTPVVKSIYNGERASAYSTFIKPLEESNSGSLKVLRYSAVQEVLINEKKTAYGVAYLRHGIPQISYASKEVIISCGTFQSPLLLIKSGIGPSSVLKKARIPVKSDLPVGKTLIDHAAVILKFTVNSPNTTLLPRLFTSSEIEEELKKFQTFPVRTGYFTRMDVGPQAFIVSKRAKQDGQKFWPDIEIVFVQKTLLDSEDGKQEVFLQVILNRPKSKGEIGFNTTAYLNGEIVDTKLALVDFRILSEPTDADVLIEGIKLALKIMENTTSFTEMGVTYTEVPPLPCKTVPFRSDEYWRCYLSQKARSWLHTTGTCKMGRENDPSAVVDSKLKVRGIHKLRVVDASVLPRPTNANINGAVMLVAEKTLEEILTQYLAKAV